MEKIDIFIFRSFLLYSKQLFTGWVEADGVFPLHLLCTAGNRASYLSAAKITNSFRFNKFLAVCLLPGLLFPPFSLRASRSVSCLLFVFLLQHVVFNHPFFATGTKMIHNLSNFSRTADIFRGIMVSLYVKGRKIVTSRLTLLPKLWG